MGQHNKTKHGEKLQRAAWVAKAIKLACEGWSARQIATKVGKHHSTVSEALNREFEERRPPEEEVALARALKRERLGSELARWRARSEQGDHHAGHLVVRLEGLLADLEGTDAPKQPENVLNVSAIATTNTTDESTVEVGPEAAARIVRELFGARAATPADDPGHHHAGGAPPAPETPHPPGSGEVPARPTGE